MSNRSLFPNGVDVIGDHLQRESFERSQETRRLADYLGGFGVVQGLVVTVNPTDNTRINLSSGWGVAPNGEYVALASPANSLGITNTLGTRNYVLLVYDELKGVFAAHESDGTTLPTRAEVLPRVVVITEANYNALPQSDPDLSRNARDRALICAIVTGTGGPLGPANIQLPTVFNTVFTVSGFSISGVNILQLGQTNTTGSAEIKFSTGPTRLAYKGAGDASFGADVNVLSSGSYLLTSPSGKTVLVSVTFPQLPLVNVTDAFTISTVYTQTVPRFSAEDLQHRSLIGQGLPTANNPHGMTLDDLSPGAAGTLEQHQDVMHTNGIVKGSSAGFLSITVDTSTTPDRLIIGPASPGDAVYINGRRIQEINGSNILTFTTAPATAGLYGIYMSQDGVLFTQEVVGYGAGSPLTPFIQVSGISPGWPSGPQLLDYNTGISFQSLSNTFFRATIVQSVRLFENGGNRSRYIDLYSSGSAGTANDNISFTAEPNLEENYLIGYVWWSGSSTGFLGNGFGPSNSPNLVNDRRTYGTLDTTVVDEGALQGSRLSYAALGLHGLVYKLDQFYRRDGAPVAYTEYSPQMRGYRTSSVGLSFTVTAGYYFTNGVLRRSSDTTLTLPDNTLSRIYLDTTGVVKQSVQPWVQIESPFTKYDTVRMFEVTTSGGAVTNVAFVGNWVDVAKDAPGGVVGIDAVGKVLIQAQGQGITSYPTLAPLVNIRSLLSTLPNALGINALTLGLSITSTDPSTAQGILITSANYGIGCSTNSDSPLGANAFVNDNVGTTLWVTNTSTGLPLLVTAAAGNSSASSFSNNSATSATIVASNPGGGPAFQSTNGGARIPPANQYQFASPRTRRKWFKPTAHTSAVGVDYDFDLSYESFPGPSRTVWAQITIPANAVITTLYISYNSNPATSVDSTIRLYRYLYDGFLVRSSAILLTQFATPPLTGPGDVGSIGWVVPPYAPISGVPSPNTTGYYLAEYNWPTSGVGIMRIVAFGVDFTYSEVSGLEL